MRIDFLSCENIENGKMTLRFMLVSQLFNELFKNNANRSEMAEKRHNQNYFMEMTTVEGVYDYLMYVGKFQHHSSSFIAHFLFSNLNPCAAETTRINLTFI